MRGLLVSILAVALCGEMYDITYSQTVSPGGVRSDGAAGTKGDSRAKKELCIKSIDVELILPFGKRKHEPFRICFFANSELIASAEIPDSFGVACRIDTTLSLQMNEKDTLKVSQIPDSRLDIFSDVPLPSTLRYAIVSIAARTETGAIKQLLNRRPADKLSDSTGTAEWMLGPKETANDTSFTITVGANFDFLNKLHVTSLYYDVDAFIPNIINNRYGFEAGLYQFQSNARSALGDSGSAVSSANTIGFYFVPFISLESNRYYVGFDFEYRLNQYSIDSGKTAAGKSVGTGMMPVNEFLTGPYFSYYFHNKYVELYVDEVLVRPIIGAKFSDLYKGTLITESLTEFSIKDRSSQIQLGGWVIQSFTGAPTRYMVYLAKVFTFSDISNFFKGLSI